MNERHGQALGQWKSIYGIALVMCMTMVISLTSCEGYACGRGFIYDDKTRQPIDSVICTVITGSEIGFSDSTGLYEVCNPFGGCVPHCPDIVVEFSKVGYKTQQATNPKDIYLIK